MDGLKEKRIVLAHGGGGELTQRLLKEHVLPRLGNDWLDPLGDSAVLPPVTGKVCFTTDAFVVKPLEFPGGDIGRLAVCGTVNDLAVMGARPLALSLAMVIEEGLPLDLFDRVIDSVAKACGEAGVKIVTGDTKVVERGAGDGLILTTAGLGELRQEARLDARRVRPGDGLILTGPMAEHGLAVMAAREGLRVDTEIRSDAAPLNSLVKTMIACAADVKFLRDPTRGGVAGVLADLVDETGLGIEIQEKALPVTAGARHLAELLGLDPLTIANEGKIVAVAAWEDCSLLLDACRSHPLGKGAALIGRFVDGKPAVTELVTAIGGRRIVPRPYGEELPRIC